MAELGCINGGKRRVNTNYKNAQQERGGKLHFDGIVTVPSVGERGGTRASVGDKKKGRKVKILREGLGRN